MKILLLGDSGVGKSCIVLRYTDNTFSQNLMSSIGVDFKLKNIEIDNKTIKLQIWDTAGMEKFRTLTTSYYKGAHAFLIIFDITMRDSFEHIRNWMADIDKFAKPGVLRVLVGNKCDLENERVVNENEAKEIALKYGINYIETSAKEKTNIESLFIDTIKNLLSKQKIKTLNSNNIGYKQGIDLTKSNQEVEKNQIQNSICC